MPNTHAHIFQRAGMAEAYKKPRVSFPSVPWSNMLLLWVYTLLKGQRMNAAWKLCKTTLHIRRNELLLTLICVPTPCFCISIEAKSGAKNGGFPESWTAKLGRTKKAEHRLKFQAPKGFSIHHLRQSLAIVQIQTHILTSGREVSSA